MIRYDLKLQQGGVYTMRAQPRGRYVKHEDAALLEKQVDYVQGRITELRAQLAEVARERDTFKAMVDLHDALNDQRREKANQTPFKRRKYENE